MPRDLCIGNGNFFASFDKDALLRELCFPHVGQENHVNGHTFRIGIWVDEQISWIGDGWQIHRKYLPDSLVTHVEWIHEELGLSITSKDFIDFYENIYFKKLNIENRRAQERALTLFLAHDFNIYGNDIGDTAEFRPETKSLLHYKGDRYFLINVFANEKYGLDFFATGNKGREGQEGCWKDAEDGILSQNPIAQGSVDSIIGIPLSLPPEGSSSFDYWIAAGTNWEDVDGLNAIIKKKTPASFFKRTFDYWKLWVNKEEICEEILPKNIIDLYKRSLLICRTHVNNCGSIIAANDSEVMYFNKDTYSYMWPRDAALTAHALDCAGYEFTQIFYQFCAKIIEKDGYFLHKYTPSGSLASSWHPRIAEGELQLPIQEDETALVIWALWHHFCIFRELEFIRPLYKTLIRRAADFFMSYRDAATGLPLPSYDLWEERRGILTFTSGTVYGGLIAAANFAEAFGETEIAEEYRQGALQLRQAMDKYLYLEKEKRFARMVHLHKDGSIEVDATIDASIYGIFAFGAYDACDEKVKNTMEQIHQALWDPIDGGLARYENDLYYREHTDATGNPWFITTLWLAQYYIAKGKDKSELLPALEILNWVASHALPSGVLAEQVNPQTGEPISVSPLTWSHAAFITVVQEYIKKFKKFETCQAYGLSKTDL